jgi:hypothetical protein
LLFCLGFWQLSGKRADAPGDNEDQDSVIVEHEDFMKVLALSLSNCFIQRLDCFILEKCILVNFMCTNEIMIL